MNEQANNFKVAELTTEIIKAIVSSNQLPPERVVNLTEQVGSTLANLPSGNQIAPNTKEPAVPIDKSITQEFLICLEDGKKYKSLKRHLRKLGMTPEQYRKKWKLRADYPMVAPGYSKQRSEMAKEFGLGQRGVLKKKAARS
jgi:predicted transcriptional regulator